jgi:PAS domain S-box-containing protein
MTTDASRDRLRAAVESSPSGLLMIDGDGRIVLVNREIERLFGYSREELLGKSVDMLVPERFRSPHPGHRQSFLARPRVRAMGAGRDLFGLRKDGSEVPVEIGLTPVVTEEGLFVLSSIVDIGARKRAEERFRAAVESSPNGMVMVDGEGRVVLVNREIERMFGYGREELLGQRIEMLVPERFRGQHPTDRVHFFAAPSSRAMGIGRDLFGLRKDGTEIPVEIGLNPIQTDEGLFVLSSIVDIGARKAAEQGRRELEEQLRQAQKMEAVGTLAGGIAHDFNNILGAIMGYGELLSRQVTDPQAGADVRGILDAAERGRQLVQHILAFSRRQELTRTPLAVGPTMAQALKLLRPTLPAPVELRLTVHPDAPRILADATAIHQVLMNLATNAAYAMPGGGAIDVMVEPFYVRDSVARARPDLREGTYTVVSVRDTGPGMDRAVRERAFEPFFTTKPAGQGTGLGLAVVHGIMKEHGGTVEIDSEPGAGTTVRCLFPALAGDDEVAAAAEQVAVQGHGERVLLVEDERALAAVGERHLTALGYKAVVETDSLRALERFRADPHGFDLLITDYSMPRLMGIAMVQAVLEIRRDIPILMITGFIEDELAEHAAAIGVHRLLRKPVPVLELAEAIRTALAPAGTAAPKPGGEG